MICQLPASAVRGREPRLRVGAIGDEGDDEGVAREEASALPAPIICRRFQPTPERWSGWSMACRAATAAHRELRNSRVRLMFCSAQPAVLGA